MSWGVTTVICGVCKKKSAMYGWMPMAWTIWNEDEGLECCKQQTDIIGQVEGEQ